MTGYVRADVTNQIANGNTINAAPLDAEFDALQGVFDLIVGHRHDGSAAEGAPITVVGPAQDIVVSALVLRPKIDNTIDLGTSTLEFKDLWVDGTANIDSLVADTADINAGTIDATTIGATTPAAATVTTLTATSGTVGGAAITTASNTQTLTNKTLNLTNNTLVATSAQLASAITDETGTGAVVFSESPALTGTPTAPTAAAATNTTQLATTAHVFAERSNTATLTNKTLTSPVITGGTVDGAPFFTASTAATLTNKTINLANNTLVGTSAQLDAAITDGTGVGLLVFNTIPFLSSAVLTGTSTIGGVVNVNAASFFGGNAIFDGLTTINGNAAIQNVALNGFVTVTDDFIFGSSVAQKAATRSSLGAATTPQTATGVGQFVALSAAADTNLVLPASGSWLWWIIQRNSSTLVVNDVSTNISAGGSTIFTATVGVDTRGWAWRIA